MPPTDPVVRPGMRAGRLTSSSEFRLVYAGGRRASSPAVVAHVLVTGEQRPPRVGVSAVKGLGGAVQRNRAKRVLREAMRQLPRPIKPGADVVLVATRVPRSSEFQNMVNSLEDVLVRAGGFNA